MSNRHQVRRSSGCRSRQARGGRERKRDLSHAEHVEQVERQSKLEGRGGVGEWRLDNHVEQVEQVDGERVQGVWRRWDSDLAAAGNWAEWRKKLKRLAAESCRWVDIFKSHFGKRGQTCFPKMEAW